MASSVVLALLSSLAVPFLPYVQHFFSSGPVVSLDYGTFQGASADGVASFLGMPFAAPPVGPLRFARPQPPLPFSGTHQATSYGHGCHPHNLTINPQFSMVPLPFSDGDTLSEDCLTINVYKPANVPAGAKLPVVFFIHGGGFTLGTTSKFDSGDALIKRSVKLDHPVVYVSANYRLNALGWLTSKELAAEGSLNVGLYDQRLALHWVQQHIAAFGGDPGRVILWGQSAGSVSIGTHMAAYGGDTQGLFHGAFMQSGALIPLRAAAEGQEMYDSLTTHAGCAGTSDTLACLRTLSTAALVEAIHKLPNQFMHSAFRYAWQPRIDGEIVRESPVSALEAGRYAKIPFITGDDDDEGTLFSLSAVNVTTEEEFKEYISYSTIVSAKQAARIADAYSPDPAHGSPFNTGDAFQLSPQYKRIAAVHNDWVFHGPRRALLQREAGKQQSWAYLWKRGQTASFLGAVHCGSCGQFRIGSRSPDFLINFMYNFDPNAAVVPAAALSVPWPTYGSAAAGALLTFSDPDEMSITHDTFRAGPMRVLADIAREIARSENARLP